MKILRCDTYRDGGTKKYYTDIGVYYFVLARINKNNAGKVLSNVSGNFPKDGDGESLIPAPSEVMELIDALKEFDGGHFGIIHRISERYSLDVYDKIIEERDGYVLKCGDCNNTLNDFSYKNMIRETNIYSVNCSCRKTTLFEILKPSNEIRIIDDNYDRKLIRELIKTEDFQRFSEFAMKKLKEHDFTYADEMAIKKIFDNTIKEMQRDNEK